MNTLKGECLIDSVCFLTNMEEYSKMIRTIYRGMKNKPDNFCNHVFWGDNSESEYSLNYILANYYGETFKYPESVECSAFEKLKSFLWGIPCDLTADMVEKLDELNEMNVMRDRNGDIIRDDDEIRICRNAKILFSLFEMQYGQSSDVDFWRFYEEVYPDCLEMKDVIESSEADDADEIMSEYLRCIDM